MEKKEILEVLKEMLADYESALVLVSGDKRLEDLIFEKNMELGFCYWLKKSIYVVNRLSIIYELRKDIFLSIEVLETGFWHPEMGPTTSENYNKENCLLPRAKHLLRTIARLENELK